MVGSKNLRRKAFSLRPRYDTDNKNDCGLLNYGQSSLQRTSY